MSDLSQHILAAWNRIQPVLQNNPDELARRLARRRLKTLRRPLRAYCVAVRASDHRINLANALIEPEEAAYPGRPDLYGEHRVTLTAKLLRELCRPVWVDPPGADWKVVAKMLGCSKTVLRHAMNKGYLRVYHVKGFEGQFGKPIPLVWSPHALDPCAAHVAEPPEPVFGALWHHLVDTIPDDLEQTLLRRPREVAWEGKLVNRGWWWICPGCRKRARLVYYPLPAMNLVKFYGIDPASAEWDEIEPPPPTFACFHCHGIRTFSRCDKNSWNELIHHLSGGLLYGSEVERPSWLNNARKRRFSPKINRAPSKRREEVLERLLLGWRHRAIA